MSDFDSAELPSLRSWAARYVPQPDASAYLAHHLSVTNATLFAELLAPDLVLVRGCVLLRSRYVPENFDTWWSHCEGVAASIEASINRLHLWDLFEPSDDVERRALDAIANRLARSWLAHANLAFPDRKFVTAVTDEYGPTVVLHSDVPELR
ncbi:MAG: hypothetical protein J7518_05895 [Nocardioidaceae bacterium]|nr:hypothetical protein [Nocardioidaceae bacterium]